MEYEEDHDENEDDENEDEKQKEDEDEEPFDRFFLTVQNIVLAQGGELNS